MIERDKYLSIRTNSRESARKRFGLPDNTPCRRIDGNENSSAAYQVWVSDDEPEGDGWRRD